MGHIGQKISLGLRGLLGYGLGLSELIVFPGLDKDSGKIIGSDHHKQHK